MSCKMQSAAASSRGLGSFIAGLAFLAVANMSLAQAGSEQQLAQAGTLELRRNADGKVVPVEAAPALPAQATPSGQAVPRPPVTPGTVPNATSGGSTHCRASVVCVGPKSGIVTIAAGLAVARPGDTVEIAAATYRETIEIGRPNVTLRGVGGRPVLDCEGIVRRGKHANCVHVAGNNTIIENLEIANAKLKENGPATCIGNAPGHSLVMRRVACHSSNRGPHLTADNIVIEDSEFYGNGHHTWSHDSFITCDTLTIRNSQFRDIGEGGYLLAAVCRKVLIVGSRFHASRKYEMLLDFPEGGEIVVDAGVFSQTVSWQTPIIRYGTKGKPCKYPGQVMVTGTRFVFASASTVEHTGSCGDKPIEIVGAKFEGPQPKLLGNTVIR